MMNKVEEIIKWLTEEATIRIWAKIEHEAEDNEIAVVKKINSKEEKLVRDIEEKAKEDMLLLVGAYKKKEGVEYFSALLTRSKWDVIQVDAVNEESTREIRKCIEKNRLRLFTQREMYEVLK